MNQLRISLHIGLTTATYDLPAILELNRGTLTDAGWLVGPEAHDPLPPDHDVDAELRAAEQTLAAWAEWIADCTADSVILSCPHLGDATLVAGQATTLLQSFPDDSLLVCAAVVRRIDDYIATRYIDDLLQGRSQRLNDRELAGRGAGHYFARLGRWRDATGPSFRAIACAPQRSDEDALRRLLQVLQLPGSTDYVLPSPSPVRQLSGTAAETLRRFNGLMDRNGLDAATAAQLRSDLVASLLTASDGEPFAIPTESARSLLRDFERPAQELARTMEPAEADRFLSQDLPPEQTVDGPEVDERLRALAEEHGLTLGGGSPHSDAAKATSAVTAAAHQAVQARLDHDEERYRRSTRRLRRLMRSLPEYREGGVERSGSRVIPDRVIQYWDPSPPPTELAPWFASWRLVGLPGGYHHVGDYDDGLSAVREVAGDLGVRAFERAPHPAMRSDLYRYAELHLRGGWYVDAEHEALLALTDIFRDRVDHVFVIRSKKHRMPNGFIGAVAGSPLMKEALIRGCRNLLEGKGSTVPELTGPKMFTTLVDEYLLSDSPSYIIIPSGVAFSGVLQNVHHLADYKTHGHWRYADLSGITGPR